MNPVISLDLSCCLSLSSAAAGFLTLSVLLVFLFTSFNHDTISGLSKEVFGCSAVVTFRYSEAIYLINKVKLVRS